MANILKAPGQYIQGKGELKNLGKIIKRLGRKYLIILSERARERYDEIISVSFLENELDFVYEIFGGECSLEEIDRITQAGREHECDVVISIGGGKAIDTGKAVATYLNAASVIIPTIASNDAPCSGLSVVYNEEGVVVKVIFSKRNPDYVIVDSELIVKAPVRFFTAGMGDALATYYEARACKASGARTMARGSATNTVMMMAELCRDLILKNGYEAKCAAEKKEVNQAVEDVLEASILLSGIGFESGGLAAAHAVNDGLVHVAGAHGAMHGEKVAFGLLVQLMLEHADEEEINQILDFCIAVGLPVCLKDLGAETVVLEEIREAARAACVKTQSTKNMPFEVNEEDVYQAILEADRQGSMRRK